jgi:hypothetical protein
MTAYIAVGMAKGGHRLLDTITIEPSLTFEKGVIQTATNNLRQGPANLANANLHPDVQHLMVSTLTIVDSILFNTRLAGLAAPPRKVVVVDDKRVPIEPLRVALERVHVDATIVTGMEGLIAPVVGVAASILRHGTLNIIDDNELDVLNLPTLDDLNSVSLLTFKTKPINMNKLGRWRRTDGFDLSNGNIIPITVMTSRTNSSFMSIGGHMVRLYTSEGIDMDALRQLLGLHKKDTHLTITTALHVLAIDTSSLHLPADDTLVAERERGLTSHLHVRVTVDKATRSLILTVQEHPEAEQCVEARLSLEGGDTITYGLGVAVGRMLTLVESIDAYNPIHAHLSKLTQQVANATREQDVVSRITKLWPRLLQELELHTDEGLYKFASTYGLPVGVEWNQVSGLRNVLLFDNVCNTLRNVCVCVGGVGYEHHHASAGAGGAAHRAHARLLRHATARRRRRGARQGPFHHLGQHQGVCVRGCVWVSDDFICIATPTYRSLRLPQLPSRVSWYGAKPMRSASSAPPRRRSPLVLPRPAYKWR